MMRFELGLEEPDPKRAVQSAATIAGSYIAGGFIPLVALHAYPQLARGVSLVGGCYLAGSRGLWLHQRPLHRLTPRRSALQTIVIGGLAAGAAFLIAKAIS